MRTTLMSAALAGLIALGALPAAAAEGPGHDLTTPKFGAVITIDYGNDGRYSNQPGYYGPNGYPNWNRDWNQDGYNRPSYGWGNNGWWNGYYNRQPLPDWVIRQRISRQNFRDIGKLKMKDGYYRVNAENWRGQDVRLIVDAYTGRVVDVDRR